MTRTPLRALSRITPCERAVFIGGGLPEYEEDYAVTGALLLFTARINAHEHDVVHDKRFYAKKSVD